MLHGEGRGLPEQFLREDVPVVNLIGGLKNLYLPKFLFVDKGNHKLTVLFEAVQEEGFPVHCLNVGKVELGPVVPVVEFKANYIIGLVNLKEAVIENAELGLGFPKIILLYVKYFIIDKIVEVHVVLPIGQLNVIDSEQLVTMIDEGEGVEAEEGGVQAVGFNDLT